MRYIDPHIHMVSRTTDDYERMAQAGCVAITEPAFWAGFDRSSPQGFFDYFRQLTESEPQRAKRVLEVFSDPSSEPIDSAAGMKGAHGAFPEP